MNAFKHSIPSSYEVHLIKEVKRKGLGKFLIQILELIGHRYINKGLLHTGWHHIAHYLNSCYDAFHDTSHCEISNNDCFS